MGWQGSSNVEGGKDCNDEDPRIHPNADEECDDVDNDCDFDVDEDPVDGIVAYLDFDGDGYGSEDETLLCDYEFGYTRQSGDCDDTNSNISPDAEEICDDIDNDCDREIDDVDFDEDGFIDDKCFGDDCDDRNYLTNPNAYDICFDGQDNNCNLQIDENDESCLDNPKESGCSHMSSSPSRLDFLIAIFILGVLRQRRR